MQLVRPYSPTQYLRIFVIVHLVSFGLSKTALDAYYKPPKPQPNPIRTKPKSSLPIKPVPDYQNATDALESARSGPLSPSSPTRIPHHLPATKQAQPTMAPKTKGENTKKAAGNAKKAEVAAQKQAAANAQEESEESSKWSKGAKSTKKADDAADKAKEKAAAKAERDKLLAEEEKNAPAKGKAEKNAKTAQKKTRGTLNLDDLDSQPSTSNKEQTLNATGIDNALDALDLTENASAQKIERHPERRFKAAYAAFEERRLPEIEVENPGLRKNQRQAQARKEFERHPDNPFNMASVAFDASREEVREVREKVRSGVEGRLGEK